MRMRIEIIPKTAFGTELLGETLFGQLCWAIRHNHSTKKLQELLEGYTEGHPFAVVSDAFYHDYIPLPSLPLQFWNTSPENTGKQLKLKRWLNLEDRSKPLKEWINFAKSDKEVLTGQENNGESFNVLPGVKTIQMHNTISRQTNTTGEEQFSPYSVAQTWYHPEVTLDIYAVIDERLTKEELIESMTQIGETGFGKDASSGLGKFKIKEVVQLPDEGSYRSCITLASSFPGGMNLTSSSYYRVKTHFGRHGDILANGQPFKKPLLLAERGAFYTFQNSQDLGFAGSGIGNVSRVFSETVHQGYAPIISLSELE